MARPPDLAPYLAQLRAMPFVRAVTIDKSSDSTLRRSPDAVVTIQTPAGKARYELQVKASNMSHAVAAGLIARPRSANAKPILLFSYYIPPAVADELAECGVQFVDEMGNQHLRIGDRYFVRVSGKRPTHALASANRSTQTTGYLVYFALLAERTLRGAPVRTIAAAVGVSKTAVSNAIGKLERDRLIVRRPRDERWLDAPALLDRWLVGYSEVVRPRLFMGGYRTQDPNPGELEVRLEHQMPRNVVWAFGGGAAARRLTGHYRGEMTLIHASGPLPDFSRVLRAIRMEQKPTLVVLRAPGPLLLQGVTPRTVHPLLVYTELLHSGDERAREAAAGVRDQYLKESLS